LDNIQYARCARCKVFLKGPAEPEPQSVFACPTCGTSDTYENVVAEIRDYHKVQAAKKLQSEVRSLGAEHKWMNVKLNPIPEKDFRFIIDVEPGGDCH
jgi:hypothetical protein